jgi:hypothetical protein
MKSACVYCPFAHNKSNLATLEARQKAHPEQTAAALVLEHMSLALNPRGSLYRAETLATMAQRSGNTPALDLYRGTIAAGDWAIYRVRRLYGAKGEAPGEETAKKGTVQRAVEKIAVFRTENDALSALLKLSFVEMTRRAYGCPRTGLWKPLWKRYWKRSGPENTTATIVYVTADPQHKVRFSKSMKVAIGSG